MRTTLELSIRETLAGGQAEKSYLTSFAQHGYEMGVGKADEYEAHAHEGFLDIAFAPGGLSIGRGVHALYGRLHITSPRRWFGPIKFNSDFWFIKFFQSQTDVCSIPDKLTIRNADLGSGCIVVDVGELATPLFHGHERQVRLALGEESLIVCGLPETPDLRIKA